MKRVGAIAAATAMLLQGASLPARAEDRLSGDEIRRSFEAHTVSGRFLDGKLFSEYHDADGRAVGFNGTVPNTDACWIIKDDQICYYYGPPSRRRTHCYRVQPVGKLLVLHHTASSRLNAFVTTEPGNPRHLSDNGRPWYCDGLISQVPEQGEPLPRRLAAR